MITDYLEERLPQADRLRFDQHLSVCPACITYLDQMRLTVKALGTKPPMEIPETVRAELTDVFRRWKRDQP